MITKFARLEFELFTKPSNLPGLAEKVKPKVDDLIKEVSFLQRQKRSKGQKLVTYVYEELGVKISLDEANKLLGYRNLTSLLNGILAFEETILQNIIVEDPEPYGGKNIIEVLYSEPKGIVAHPVEEVITLEQARFMLQDKVTQLFWQVRKEVLDPVIKVSLSTLLPTLKYDQKENDRRIQEIVRRYPSKVIHYKPGDVLVPFRKVLSEEDLLLIVSHGEFTKKNLYGNTPWILIVTLLIVVFHDRLFLKIIDTERQKTLPYRPVLFLLIISIFLFKFCLLFTPFPLYSLPFALLPLLVVLLNYGRIAATWSTVIGAILLTLFSTRTFEIFLFFTLGGLTAVLLCSKIQKRIHILLPSLVVGIINVGVLFAYSTKWENMAPLMGNWHEIWAFFQAMVSDKRLSDCLGWAFVGGVLAGPMALFLLPILEMSWRAASNFKLTKYSDLQHPLLKDLFAKIPATYQHSMTMAFLAQAVGEAVGANTLLLRIGAYYHDIGKMADPMFFSENQSSGENPHDNLDPQESAQIIINHVKYGEQIARKMGLPEVIVDFIRQHHGTMFVEYFYNKAVEANPESKPRREDFRYSGPKPQSLEAAILMIVDAVEATFRSMESTSREKVEKMIILNIVKRIADGQFNECNLSTRNIAKIIETLTDSLEATSHPRVAYPWQEKNKR
ncbi:MAG: HDIG domain-containing protein [Deltaproteobacteria bacterium]|nr:HDIG domain-containing protein [Deltaproteobacteria bacterium]